MDPRKYITAEQAESIRQAATSAGVQAIIAGIGKMRDEYRTQAEDDPSVARDRSLESRAVRRVIELIQEGSKLAEVHQATGRTT